MKSNQFTVSSDSEEFLSQLAPILVKDPFLFPITENSSDNARKILSKIFWPLMHLRHMLYTEGGITMTQTFADGIRNNTFSRLDFLAWKWRWLTNLFAFHGGPTAKYYDSETHCLVSMVIAELEKMFDDVEYQYLENYLLARARIAGLTQPELNLTIVEQQFLGHLVAYFHRVNILDNRLGKMVYDGYMAFKNEFQDEGNLSDLYQKHFQDEQTVTPTYVPAIINNAYCIFNEKQGEDLLNSIKLSTQFMCTVAANLYALPRHTRIVCMNISKIDVLSKIVEDWRHDHQAFHFVLDSSNSLTAQPQLQMHLSLS